MPSAASVTHAPATLHAPAQQPATKPSQRLAPGSVGFNAMALLCTVLWASAQIAAKEGLAHCPPMYLMSIRFLLAGALLQPLCWAVGSPWPSGRAGMGRLLILGVLNNTLYLGITAVGLQHVSAGLNCVLTGANPLLLAVGAYLMLGERVSTSTFVGLLGALSGVVWAMAGRLGHDNRLSGIALIMLANCIMVAGNLLYKSWQSESGLLRSHSVQLLVGGVTLLGVAVAQESVADIHLTANFVAAELFLIFGVSLGAMLIWLFMLARGDAGRAGAFLFLVPLFGLGLGALFLGETLSLSDGLGALLSTLCVGWVQWPRRKVAIVR